MPIDPTRTLVGQTILSAADPHKRLFRVDTIGGPFINVRPPSYDNPAEQWRVRISVKAMGPLLSKATGEPLAQRGEARIDFRLLPAPDRQALLARLAEDKARRIAEHEENMRKLAIKELVLTEGDLPAEVEAELIAAERASIEERLAEVARRHEQYWAARQAQEAQS